MAKKWVERVIKILNEMSAHHVGAYAAQAAYFFMLSMIPIILLLLTMVQYTPVTKADVMTAVLFPLMGQIHLQGCQGRNSQLDLDFETKEEVLEGCCLLN